MKVFEFSGIKIAVDTYLQVEKDMPRNLCERTAVLRILSVLTGKKIADISHHSDGAPYLADMSVYISISHCRTHLAVAISCEEYYFGIDIENFRNSLLSVKNRFLSEKSLAVWDTGNKMLLCAWTIMEATYKAARVKGLDIRNDIEMIPENNENRDEECLHGTSNVMPINKKFSFISVSIDSCTVLSLVKD